MPSSVLGATRRRGRAGRLFRLVLAGGVLALVLVFAVAYVRSSNACDAGPLVPGPTPMTALVRCTYGGPEVLQLARIPRPAPGPGELLVRVRAASVNPLDWHYVRGVPRVMRLASGLRVPSDIRVGSDFAGVVEAVGVGVTDVGVGDEVFGLRHGALAEYLVVAAHGTVHRKPSGLSFEAAAAAPLAAVTALQGLRDHAQVRRGQRVLVNGASGGVGTFAVQVARQLGAHVTGVCSTRNVAMVQALGADRVIDYTSADVTQLPDRYDVVFDTVGNHGLGAIAGILAEGGRYVGIGGGSPRDALWLGPVPRVVAMMVRSLFVSPAMTTFVARGNQADLAQVSQWLADGVLRSQIDRTLPFSQAAEAIRYLEQGRARGKVVVVMPAPNDVAAP